MWHADVKIAFNWIRETLLLPLSPGSKVIVFGSGEALSDGRHAAICVTTTDSST